MQKPEPVVSVSFGTLLQAPMVDIHSNDFRMGQVLCECEYLFASRTAETQDSGARQSRQPFLAFGKQHWVTVFLGCRFSLKLLIFVDDPGDHLRADSWVSDKAPQRAQRLDG